LSLSFARLWVGEEDGDERESIVRGESLVKTRSVGESPGDAVVERLLPAREDREGETISKEERATHATKKGEWTNIPVA
jgi:hypothetical protein